MSPSGAILPILAAALLALGAGIVAYAVATGETFVTRLSDRYVAHLDRELRLLFMAPAGRTILVVQSSIAAGLLLSMLFWPRLFTSVLIALTLLGPELWIRRQRRNRTEKLEEQIDGFVVALANALKTVPSPAAALSATTMILPQPTKQEIEQVLKEVRVGSTLEEGLLAMSARVRSRWVDVAFSSVLIGLRVGGNLPAVLERTAGTIREINRLLGVVRTRTSEGRAQLWVLALFPAAVVGVFSFIQPGYFDPLEGSFVGQICIGLASTLWIAALLLGRKILAVDV